MKIAIMIPMWRRLKLANYIFNYYNKIKLKLLPSIELSLLAVGSQGAESREVAERNGFDYIEVQNQPLNRKHNAVVLNAKQYDPDAVIIVGSDDIISIEYFKIIMPEDNSVIGLLDLYFLNLMEEKLGYWGGYSDNDVRVGYPIGVGRCFSRAILERCNWQLWPEEQRHRMGLDRYCISKLRTLGIGFKGYTMKQFGCFAMDIKTDIGIRKWAYSAYEKVVEGYKMKKILKKVGVLDILDLSFLDEESNDRGIE